MSANTFGVLFFGGENLCIQHTTVVKIKTVVLGVACFSRLNSSTVELFKHIILFFFC